MGGTQGRSVSLFSGGEGLNPLLLHKAPFPVPQVYTTFVSSHNVCEPNPISENRPEAILARDAVNFDSIEKGRLKHLDPPKCSRFAMFD